MARQATDAESKLQNSHNDSEKKSWDWDRYVTLHKKQHTIIKSLVDHGYSGMDKGTKVHHFLKGIKSTKLEKVVNVVSAQPEKYGKDFDATVSYLGQIVTKKGNIMQSACSAKTKGSWQSLEWLHS